jgi:hypothetical protein
VARSARPLARCWHRVGQPRSLIRATVDPANQWLASAHEAVQANSVGGYVNYVEPDNAAARYFSANLLRLNAIRQTYDPNGLMYSGMSY